MWIGKLFFNESETGGKLTRDELYSGFRLNNGDDLLKSIKYVGATPREINELDDKFPEYDIYHKLLNDESKEGKRILKAIHVILNKDRNKLA